VAVVFAILALVWSGGAVGAASPSPSSSAEPSASPVGPPVITWTRAALPADLGTPVDLTWGGRGLLLLAQAARPRSGSGLP
jgi:hypothetical protein